MLLRFQAEFPPDKPHEVIAEISGVHRWPDGRMQVHTTDGGLWQVHSDDRERLWKAACAHAQAARFEVQSKVLETVP